MADDPIMEWLRSCKCQKYGCMHKQAADEIERLREQLDARFDRQAVINIVGSVEDVLNTARRLHDTQLIQAEVLQAQNSEIERLRSAVAIAAGMLSTREPYTDWHPEAVMQMIMEETRRG